MESPAAATSGIERDADQAPTEGAAPKKYVPMAEYYAAPLILRASIQDRPSAITHAAHVMSLVPVIQAGAVVVHLIMFHSISWLFLGAVFAIGLVASGRLARDDIALLTGKGLLLLPSWKWATVFPLVYLALRAQAIQAETAGGLRPVAVHAALVGVNVVLMMALGQLLHIRATGVAFWQGLEW